ncbi:MAG: hypothetical protein K2K57_06200 [Oscillospiraceae bacterium]|nr:hypothetical protein [Oscillospiraceae bacterium]
MAVRDGYYVIYHNKEYSLFYGKIENKKNVLILSHNPNDINNGFKLSYSEEYMKEHQFFTCEKEVPKSEISEAYKIKTYADYKGFRLYVYGQDVNNVLRLVTVQELSHSSKSDGKIRETLMEMGFKIFDVEKTGCTYVKYVPIDDPELELIEERTEIDISKW